MKADITAKGYTSVILVLNMKRFIAEKNVPEFERLRGTREFSNILQNVWPSQALASGRFETIADEKHHRNIEDELSTEEVGFATGIFRTPMLEEFTFPTYALNKDGFEFPLHLAENFQFKKLFLPAWKGWRIFIRPTFTGLFVIRLTRPYEKATPLMNITYDVIRLQASLDIQSARRRLVDIRTLYADQPDKLSQNENSILKFLEWLGADEKSSIRALYAPVQWRLALEVCKIFVEQIGSSILAKNGPIEFISPQSKLSSLLHDSYVIYHLDEVWADRHFIPGNEVAVSAAENVGMEIPVKLKDGDMQPLRPHNIRNSLDLQQQFSSLIEGALLKRAVDEDEDNLDSSRNKYFPRFEPDLARKIVETDVATWQDELCLLTPRATVIIPSRRSRRDELLLTTLPGSTIRFDYVRYWGAVERMIEFVVEIHVLARLLERKSFHLVGEIAESMNESRDHLFSGDIHIQKRLPSLIMNAAHLRRLTALCQSLSDPNFWGRAEYATSKTGLLMAQLGLPFMLEQIDRNIVSINSMVDHSDELSMANLAEQSNDIAVLLSLGLAALSFILTMLILPSFWKDLLDNPKIPIGLMNMIWALGTLFALSLIFIGAGLMLYALFHWEKIYKIVWRLSSHLKKTFQKKE